MNRRPVLFALGFLLPLLGGSAVPQDSPLSAPTDSTVITDSLYAIGHPRLLFTKDEVPALKSKMTDGGRDDLAFLFIQAMSVVAYPAASFDDLLGYNDDDPLPDFGLAPIPNMGLAAHLSTPAYDHVREIGRQLTVHIADTYNVDDDIFGSSLRLRALCLGFDFFLRDSDEAERGRIRDEIIAYVGYMVYKTQYVVWEWRPYLSNKTAMQAASLGLASIVLRGKADDSLLDTALARADYLVDRLLDHQWDPGGAAREGVLYGAWSLRHLIYYFEARLRYDGFDYSTNETLRRTECWLAYELDPADVGRVNNIQDCTSTDYPLARHTTYLDWAQARWQSGIAAYIWDQAASYPDGFEMGDKADKAATALWAGSIEATSPGGLLPRSIMWPQRGLYYFRTGWPAGTVSDDVVFSFYAGRFEGGHQQEDQGQFTLTAFGHRFALDHGPGDTAKESEAHNIVLIDDNGQHNAGSAIGTDAQMTSWVIGEYADILTCDAVSAYTTYSPLNAANTPFEGADWSWGYEGANPVLRSRRTVVTVRPDGIDPFFVVVDDVDKDGQTHDYAWQLHTEEDLSVDATANPVVVSGPQAVLDIHVAHPRYSLVETSLTPFDNNGIDPNSQVLAMTTSGPHLRFAAVLMPHAIGGEQPEVTHVAFEPDRSVMTVAHADGAVDVVAVNFTEDPMSVNVAPVSFETDGRVTVVRLRGLDIEGYALSEGTLLRVNDVEYVRLYDGVASVSHFGATIHVDRPDPDFVFYGPDVDEILYREQSIAFFEHNGYLSPSPVTSAGELPPASEVLRLSAFPNPLSPSSQVRIDLTVGGRTVVDVYNVRGQRVRRLLEGDLPAGARIVRWDGRGERGQRMASGVYFVRVTAGTQTRSVKLSIVR